MMQGLVTSQEYFKMKKKLQESSNMLVNARSVQPRFQEVPIFGRNLDTSFNQYSSLDANKYNKSFYNNNTNSNKNSNKKNSNNISSIINISKNKNYNKSNNSISMETFTNPPFNTEMSLINIKTFYNNKTTPYNFTNISHLIPYTPATTTDNNTSKEINTPHKLVMYLSDVLSNSQKERARKSISKSQIVNENKAFVKELKAVKFPSLPTLIISKTRVVSDSNNYVTSTELTKYDPSDDQTTNGTSLVTTHVTTLDASDTVNKNDDSYNSSSSNNSTRKHRKVVSKTGDKHKMNLSKEHNKDQKLSKRISATKRRSSISVSSSEEGLSARIKVRPSRQFVKLKGKYSDDLMTKMVEGSRAKRDHVDSNSGYFIEKESIKYWPVTDKSEKSGKEKVVEKPKNKSRAQTSKRPPIIRNLSRLSLRLSKAKSRTLKGKKNKDIERNLEKRVSVKHSKSSKRSKKKVKIASKPNALDKTIWVNTFIRPKKKAK